MSTRKVLEGKLLTKPSEPVPVEPPELLTTASVAKLYGVSEETVRRWCRKQVIGYVMVGPFRLKRIPRHEAERLMVTIRGAAT